MKYLLLLLLAIAGSASAQSFATPEETVRAFQADFLRWNNTAQELAAAQGAKAAWAQAQPGYEELLTKYTLPGFAGEETPLFSEHPLHDPAIEQIISHRTRGDSALIRARLNKDGYSPVYEYELTKSGGRWYLTQVYMVDGGERYPSL